MVENVPSVIVIGGGLSGLAAARTLLSSQQHSSRTTMQVTLLESKDRLGGRVHSVNIMGDNDTATTVTTTTAIDLGGMYWHGSSPVWQKLKREWLDWETVPTGGTSMHPGQNQAVWMRKATTMIQTNNNTNDDGIKYTELSPRQMESAQSLFDEWQAFMETSYLNHTSTHATAADTSRSSPELLQEWSDAAFSFVCHESVHHEQQQEQRLLCETWLRFQLTMTFELDHGLGLSEHAMPGLLTDWDWIDFAGEDPVSLRGMGYLVKLLADNIQAAGGMIQTNARVERILYHKNDSCLVTTTDGNVYKADACIVTLPLGVLKARATDMFVQPLSASKQAALDRAGVGVLNTVVVQWKLPVCRSNATAYYLMKDSSDRNPLRHGFICSGMLRGQNPTITQFYLGEINHPFDNHTYWKEQAWKVVRDVVPFAVEMDDIVDLKLSQWHLDPDTLGSYSAPTTLTQGNSDRRLLAESIDNVVFFAGEHTHYQGRYQSMDGAYETGERAAREVISRLRELQKKRELSEARQASVAETCDQASKERV